MPNVVDSSVLLKTVQTYNPLFERGGFTYMHFTDVPSAYCSLIMSIIHDKQYIDMLNFVASFWQLSLVDAKAIFRKWSIGEFIIFGAYNEHEKYYLCREIAKAMHKTVGTQFNENDFKRGFELYKLIELND